MKRVLPRLVMLIVLAGLAWFGWLIWTAPKHPTARIRVVDAAGKPVAGAEVQAEGMRTKPGPYASGWYGWRSPANLVPNNSVPTDPEGYATIPYPKYVFEQIETGVLCLSVSHPDFVSDRPERVVAIAPPAGAPWRAWLDDVWRRVQRRSLVAHPDPVVLQPGAILKISVQPDGAPAGGGPLHAQVSDLQEGSPDVWMRPESDVIVTRRLKGGVHHVRGIRFDGENKLWYSDIVSITAVARGTNAVALSFRRGVTVRGQLDERVPRPVRNGRVVVNIKPKGIPPAENPPNWHAWTKLDAEGNFEITSLPAGELEVVAMCDGFVSTNGPGQFQMRYPQKHELGTNDLAIVIGMEPTARLEVTVLDHEGKPLPEVRVMTWPNVRYAEWGATILMSDCYNSSDYYRGGKQTYRERPVMDFQGVSDSAGVAVLANLPADVTELAVEHSRFALPAVGNAMGGKNRNASFKLLAGQTNHISIRLEPRNQSPIRHY